MKRPSQQPKIVELKPRPGDLEQTVHRLAEDSSNVSWSNHAIDQMFGQEHFRPSGVEGSSHGINRFG